MSQFKLNIPDENQFNWLKESKVLSRHCEFVYVEKKLISLKAPINRCTVSFTGQRHYPDIIIDLIHIYIFFLIEYASHIE